MSGGKLTPLQSDFLHSWFAHSSDYFLTGGGALAGFLGAPRATDDLDLFTVKGAAFEEADRLLHQVCADLGAEAIGLRSSVAFRRYRVTRGLESTVIDLVLDHAPQIVSLKEERNGVLIDPPLEILVNKLCALVGRSEPRDFVDVFFLCQQGHDRNQALQLCSLKDGGVGQDTLLWILRDLDWDQFAVPGVEAQVVRSTAAFFQSWAEELALKLYPGR